MRSQLDSSVFPYNFRYTDNILNMNSRLFFYFLHSSTGCSVETYVECVVKYWLVLHFKQSPHRRYYSDICIYHSFPFQAKYFVWFYWHYIFFIRYFVYHTPISASVLHCQSIISVSRLCSNGFRIWTTSLVSIRFRCVKQSKMLAFPLVLFFIFSIIHHKLQYVFMFVCHFMSLLCN